MRAEIECCEGLEKYQGECLQRNCPIYKQAEEQVDHNWPYVGTGFGNLYGNPTANHYKRKVVENLIGNPKATRVNKK